MIKEYQVTLMCTTNQYKPVSAIVKVDSNELIRLGQKDYIASIRTKGIQKICQMRFWSSSDLKRYHYTKVKMREYNAEKINQDYQTKTRADAAL